VYIVKGERLQKIYTIKSSSDVFLSGDDVLL
jgi:hypothetical protein